MNPGLALHQGFPKNRRVKSSREFTLILRRGTCAADATLVLFAVPQFDDDPSRLGITIPRRTGNAVIRNRWKRLIRESFRTQPALIPHGYRFIVRPKKDANTDWLAIKKSIPYLAKKAASRIAKQSS